jgi:hypothetical protein
MEVETKGTQTIYKKKHPVRTKKMPKKDVKYYEPLYGTPQCTYEGNKRGRKSVEERQCPTLIKNEKKITILYFD